MTNKKKQTDGGEAVKAVEPREGNFDFTLRMINETVDRLKPEGAVVLSVNSIVKTMLDEYYMNGRFRSEFGREGWWMIEEFLMGLLDKNKGVPGAKTYKDIRAEVDRAIDAVAEVPGYATRIKPAFNRYRMAHFDKTIARLEHDKANMEKDRDEHPENYD